MSRRAASVALPVFVAAVGGAALLQGGFYLRQIAPLTLLAGIGATVAIGRRVRPVRALGIAAGLLGLGIAASGVVNGWPAGSAKTVLTLVFSLACFVLADRARAADGEDAVVEAISAIGVLVAAIGLISLAFHLERFTVPADTWRLASTLTYQNAAGSLFMLTMPMAAALVVRRSTPLRRASLAVQLAALPATLSRGALVGAIVAIVVLLLARALPWRELAQPAAGAALILAGAVPAILDRGPYEISGVAGLLAGSALAAATLSGRTARVLPYAVSIALVAGVAVAPFTALSGRLTLSTTDRARVWQQTIADVTDPWFGSGPGTYLLRGSFDGLPTRTTFAHNEYLQTYVETGAVGLVCALAALLLVARTVWRARRRDPIWAAAAAALAAFVVHSAFDFLWRIPALTGIAFALVALAVGRSVAPGSASEDASAQTLRDDEAVADGQDR